MAVTVRIPTTMRPLTGGEKQVPVEPGVLSDIVTELDAAHPGLGDRLLDEDGDTLGLGVVQQILYERRKIRILTSVRGKISQICFGSIRLSETGAELEHVSVRL